EELAKLDMVEATAWKSFILSQQGTSTTIEDEVSERVYFGKHVPIEESVFLTTRKSRRKVINQQPDGNARWIAIINRVIETRLRVLGALRPDVLVPMNTIDWNALAQPIANVPDSVEAEITRVELLAVKPNPPASTGHKESDNGQACGR